MYIFYLNKRTFCVDKRIKAVSIFLLHQVWFIFNEFLKILVIWLWNSNTWSILVKDILLASLDHWLSYKTGNNISSLFLYISFSDYVRQVRKISNLFLGRCYKKKLWQLRYRTSNKNNQFLPKNCCKRKFVVL